jgi:hypothetical protein
MNLVQIQERLKDMPLQAVMQYANGMNPEVPPYLALGELNRRKKMEQAMQPAEMPQGTIKEQLEQEVGLAALQKQLMNQLQTQGLRQQQAAMSQGQQMARMPGPAPQGVPQPEVPEEMEMADGGVATLRVPDDQFEFGSGGIIAFKEGGDKGRRIPTSELDIDPLGTSEAGTEAYLAKLAKEAEEKKKQEDAARLEFLERAGVPVDMSKAVQEGRVLTTNPITRDMPDNRGSAQRFPPGPPPPPASAPMPPPARQPAVQAAAPQGIAAVAPQQVAYPQAGPMQQALAAMATGPQAPYPSYDEERRKAEERNPYLKKQPGEKLEQYLATLERRDREDQERFQEMEKERTRGALWKSLMAAGEASRGQRGIGALLGGFGKTSETEMEAARGREEKQRALMREREMNRVKMAQEIESARIAASEGRFKDQREHEQKAAQYNQDNKKIDVQLATTQASIEAAQQGRQYESASAMDRERFRIEAEARERNLDRQSRERVANLPTGEERLAKSFIDNYLKENPNKKYHEAYAAYKQSGQGGVPAERQQLAELKALQSSLNKQLETTYKAEDRKKVQEQLNEVNRAIGVMAGIGATQQNPPEIEAILKKYAKP